MEQDREQDFAIFYREYAPFVQRFLQSIGCPAQDAEDITQETFVKALLHIDSYREECRFSSWLCQIAKNTWLTQLKRQRKSVPLEQALLSAQEEQTFEWLDLLERLPEPYKTVSRKKLWGGMTYAEIAASCKKSESWARVTFYRARLKLKEMTEEGQK